MDIQLHGISGDGVAVADQFRHTGTAPVVFLTAHSDEATLRRAQVTGPYGYVIKPFEDRELEIAVEIALYRHKVEFKLRQVERWLTTTLKSMGDAVLSSDVHGNVT